MSGLAHAHQPAARAPARVETAAHRARAQPSGPSNQVIQTKLRVGAVNDPLEREADRVADAVISGAASSPMGNAPAAPQRKCAACAVNEEKIQRKCEECEAEESETVRRAADGAAASNAAGGAEAAAAAVATGGAPLTLDVRAYFEPRFGQDLSDVRVHTDGVAARAADQIGARAYTLGSSIAFASGEYPPDTQAGAHLLAHELAHVAQQRSETAPVVRRTLNPVTSRCRANVDGAPANPLADLADADDRAQIMALGASNVLFAEALTRDDAALGGPSNISTAYFTRFDRPPRAPGGRFRNRFTNAVHATENEAVRGEMQSLSGRFETLSQFLRGSIRYRCAGTRSLTLPGCAAFRCGATTLGFSCPGGRDIAVCPNYWAEPTMGSVDQRAGNTIHEACHMRLRFTSHGKTTPAQRARNPECFTAFVADIFGFVSNDSTDCTPVP